jgi:hypothetical protein
LTNKTFLDREVTDNSSAEKTGQGRGAKKERRGDVVMRRGGREKKIGE